MGRSTYRFISPQIDVATAGCTFLGNFDCVAIGDCESEQDTACESLGGGLLHTS